MLTFTLIGFIVAIILVIVGVRHQNSLCAASGTKHHTCGVHKVIDGKPVYNCQRVQYGDN